MGFSIGSVFKAAFNPMNALMLTNPAGWAAFAFKAVASNFAQQLIQQIGQQLGLPQPVIDMAQSRMAFAMGDIRGGFANQREAFAALQELGGLGRADISNFEQDLNNLLANNAAELSRRGRRSGRGGAQSWIMALAEAMGRQIDAKANEMQSMAGRITDKTPSLTAKFSAASQEFGIMMNALSTVIKSAGEGMSQAARRN